MFSNRFLPVFPPSCEKSSKGDGGMRKTIGVVMVALALAGAACVGGSKGITAEDKER